MKQTILGFLIGLGMLTADAQNEDPILNLPPDSPFVLKDSGIKSTNKGAPALLISRQTRANTANIVEDGANVTVLRIPQPKITSVQYALTGEVASKNVPTDTQLELVADYFGGSTASSQTNKDGGLQQRLGGTGEFRPFTLPIFALHPGPIAQLELHVRFHGRSVVATPTGTTHEETISLRSLKLVQYSNPSSSEPAQNSPAGIKIVAVAPEGEFQIAQIAYPKETSQPPAPSALAQNGAQIDQTQEHRNALKWFCLGVATTGLVLLLPAGLALLSRRLRQRHNERELRRIASLDS